MRRSPNRSSTNALPSWVTPPRARFRRVGSVLPLVVVMFVALVGFVSLAVDVAHVQMTKSELQHAADAASRYAAAGIPNGATNVQSRATASAAENSADGSPVNLAANDVELGTWDSVAQQFTVGGSSPNAVRVWARHTSGRGNAIPLSFGPFIGKSTCDVTCKAIAVLQGATGGNTTSVGGIMNPWLAGMADGNYGGSTLTGTAPVNSPAQVPNLALVAGQQLTFAVTGTATDDNAAHPNTGWSPDGEADGAGFRTNTTGYLNGMSNLNAQQGALVGVFLDDNPPTSGATPPDLDFTGPGGIDFASLSPMLRQTFFIGDGLRSDGVTRQTFVVPAGATRLFLGTHDNTNWANNGGTFLVNIGNTAPVVKTVE